MVQIKFTKKKLKIHLKLILYLKTALILYKWYTISFILSLSFYYFTNDILFTHYPFYLLHFDYLFTRWVSCALCRIFIRFNYVMTYHQFKVCQYIMRFWILRAPKKTTPSKSKIKSYFEISNCNKIIYLDCDTRYHLKIKIIFHSSLIINHLCNDNKTTLSKSKTKSYFQILNFRWPWLPHIYFPITHAA